MELCSVQPAGRQEGTVGGRVEIRKGFIYEKGREMRKWGNGARDERGEKRGERREKGAEEKKGGRRAERK